VLLPLASALALTRVLWQSVPLLRTEHPRKLAFACSFNFSKILLVDVYEGSVCAWTRRSEPLLQPAVPNGLAEAVGLDAPRRQQAEGLVQWFEEYIRRLEAGIYVVEPLRPERSPLTKGISLFPAVGGEVARAVVHGVEVVGTCVFMPEHPQGWAYSIALQLKGSPSERGFDSCQLHARHWVIKDEDREPEHVHGEGVIGLYPILVDGGWLLNRHSDPSGQYPGPRQRRVEGPFRYQSCAGRIARGSFGGEITFVPGTISKPTGPPFEVAIAPLELCVPDYLY